MALAATSVSESDDFGLLPLNFRPGRLRRWLGQSEFCIDAEFIEVARQKILYPEIASVTAEGTQLKIEKHDGHCMRLGRVNNLDKLVVLLQQLVAQAVEYQGYQQAITNTDPDTAMQMFGKILNFRALPYVRGAETLLTIAAKNYFSDLHLEPVSSERARITFRAAGQVKRSIDIDLYQQQRLLARLKYLAGCHSHICDSAQEGAFRQNDFDVRLSIFPTDLGERAAIRIITALAFPDVAALGWQPEWVQAWLGAIQQHRGLFMISGAVGSGKTTAMYATLAELAAESKGLRVVTIEDPVEARIAGICQASLDSTREKDLASAFKHLLRQDPDIIALGEIRDRACIKEALQAALSGHLILATFHAGSPAEAVARIKQMGIEDYLVLSGLRGILHLELKSIDGRLQPVVELAVCTGDGELQVK